MMARMPRSQWDDRWADEVTRRHQRRRAEPLNRLGRELLKTPPMPWLIWLRDEHPRRFIALYVAALVFFVALLLIGFASNGWQIVETR